MKKYNCLILIILQILLLTIKGNSQGNKLIQEKELIGVWQEGDTLIAAGLQNTYRFNKDGTFDFDVSAFEFLSRLISIHGKCNIVKNNIEFYVYYTIESTGGNISFGDNSTDYNSWTYVNNHKKTIKYETPLKYIANVDIKSDKSIKVKKLIIEGLNYYKISNDPNAERDSLIFIKPW